MLSDERLVVAISSSALFDLRASDEIFRRDGLKAYADYQIAHENEPLPPGDAFPLVQKLLALNDGLQGLTGQAAAPSEPRIEVILLSRNTADTGLRVFNSIEHHGLPITRAAFTGGSEPYRYMQPFECQLFLSTNPLDVREALANGFAAATILHSAVPNEPVGDDQLRFAFDGDAVLFSDEAEQVFQADGLEAFNRSERDAAHEPLTGGPFKDFLGALHRLQNLFEKQDCPIRTALVTARSAPTHKRVITTLRTWGIRLDESLFLGGRDKAEFLKAYGADLYFDDREAYCESARDLVTTGHVPHGVANDES